MWENVHESVNDFVGSIWNVPRTDMLHFTCQNKEWKTNHNSISLFVVVLLNFVFGLIQVSYI
jgi:hypothetical protein